MTKEKIRNGVIVGGLIFATLIAIGILYFKKTTKNEEQKNIDLETNSIVKEDENTVPVNEIKSEDVPVDTQEKFNTAMMHARDAFQKKEYGQAISFYKQALVYKKSDVVHAGLYTVYIAQSDWIKAQTALDAAIQLQPSYTDYWNWKIDLLDEKTNASYQDLKNIYVDALLKVDPKTKINLITHFARIAENNNEKNEAINLWRYAIDVYPSNTSIYQAEIDRLEQL